MNSFQWPGVSVINTASIPCYIKMSFRTVKTTWNMYFLNYLCKTWSQGRHLVDSSIAHFSKSLILPILCAFILSKLLIVLMGFPTLCAAFYTKTAHECTQSKLNDMRHTWYVVSQCMPLDLRGLKGWLLFRSHWVIGGSILSRNSKQTTISELETIKKFHQMSG